MQEQMEMPRGIFYLIVALCGTIITSTSLEVMIKAKDIGLFEMWLSNPMIKEGLIGQTNNQMYSTYMTLCLSTFFVRIIAPMGLAIHSYFTLTRLRINRLYVIIWSVLLIGTFILSIIGEAYISIFVIISGICYFALVFVMIYLGKCIYNIRRL